MSKVFIITYDMRPSGHTTSYLISAIKDYRLYANISECTWLIRTEDTAGKIYTELQPYLFKNDLIFITDIGQDNAGWLIGNM